MQFKLPIVAVCASLLSPGWVFSVSIAQEGTPDVGRYQHTAVFRQEGLDRV